MQLRIHEPAVARHSNSDIPASTLNKWRFTGWIVIDVEWDHARFHRWYSAESRWAPGSGKV
jgi:hypothetical protein